MTADDAEGLVRRFYRQLWNEWDDGAVSATLSEGFTFRGSLGDETLGRDGWRRYRDQVRAGSADFHNELVELVCQPGRAAARVRCSGHHTGPLLGFPPATPPRTFRYDVAAFFRVSDGFITAAWVLGDLDRLRRQLASPGEDDERVPGDSCAQ